MSVTRKRFPDRMHAGHELAQELTRFLRGQKPYILAVPPDGVLVAAAIASELHAPLDIVVSSRVVAPEHPDETLGAITPDRTLVLNKPLVSRLGLSATEVEQISTPEWAAAQRSMQRYRRGRPYPQLGGYTAVIVDDGLTTGYTVMGAIISVRKMEPSSIIVAVPVSSLAAMERLRDYVDSLLALEINSEDTFSVAQYYTDYPAMTEQGVVWTLDRLWNDKPASGHSETF